MPLTSSSSSMARVVNPYAPQPGGGAGNDWFSMPAQQQQPVGGQLGGAPVQSPDALNWGPSLGAPAPQGQVQPVQGPFGSMGGGGAVQPPGMAQPGAVMPPQQMGGGGGPFGSFPAPSGSIGAGPPPTVGQDDDDEFLNEPPILEELGINLEHVVERIKGVAMFKGVDHELMSDADLSGPLVIALAIGVCMMLTGKLNFGYIYGLGSVGCLGVWAIINGLSQREGIDLYRTMSILGYGLLPIAALAFVNIVVSLQGPLGMVLAPLCVFWATATASRFFAVAVTMNEQRWLVAYPVGLVYACFVLITVF